MFFFPADFQIMRKNAQKKRRRVSTDFLVFRRVFFSVFRRISAEFSAEKCQNLETYLTIHCTKNNEQPKNPTKFTNGHRWPPTGAHHADTDSGIGGRKPTKKTPTNPKNPCTCSVCWFLVVDFFRFLDVEIPRHLHHHSKRAGRSAPQPPSGGLLIAQFGRSTAPPPAKSAKQLKKRRSVVYPTCIILFTCQSIQRTVGRQKHESKSTDRNAPKETRGRRLLKIELMRNSYRRRTIAGTHNAGPKALGMSTVPNRIQDRTPFWR